MTRKKRESPNAPTPQQGPAYLVWGTDIESKQKAFDEIAKGVDSYVGVVRGSHNRMSFDPGGVGGNGISGRYGLTHDDYEAWRPDENTRFKNAKQAILYADICYERHGLIRNVVDLMGDFTAQGIRIVHPNPRIQKFWQNWFRKVKGVERSERFANLFYRQANVGVRWQTAKISPRAKEKLFKARATPDMELKDLDIFKNEIPVKYTFLHPAAMEVEGGALANFVGDPRYYIKLPTYLSRLIKNPKSEIENRIVQGLPKEIREAAGTNKPIPLPKDKTRVFHYKKDDWQDWAFPMIASMAIDISLYEQLKLADRAALDGAISNLRIIKLGSLEHGIAPTPAIADKLAGILQSNTHAGTLDLIWGPDIEMLESKTQVHQFLGQAKYEPTLTALYASLGVPQTLTGQSGAGGTTNNFISLKTLTQRLEYGRDVLMQFWDEQIRIVQEAMGFRFPARIEFSFMNLGDEVSEKALLIQMADRNLISQELLQHHFGSDPVMERVRMQTEDRERERGARPLKAGPFYDPQMEEGLKRTFAQTGSVSPSELGIELLPKKKGEKNAIEQKPTTGIGGGNKGGPNKKKGQPGQGRPKTSKDSGPKRATKTFKPKTRAALMVWAANTQDDIAEIVNPLLLTSFGKKNMRSLSAQETKDAEDFKFVILCHIEPFMNVTEECIHNILSNNPSSKVSVVYNQHEKDVQAELDRFLTVNERRHVKSQFYTNLYQEYFDGEVSD